MPESDEPEAEPEQVGAGDARKEGARTAAGEVTQEPSDGIGEQLAPGPLRVYDDGQTQSAKAEQYGEAAPQRERGPPGAPRQALEGQLVLARAAAEQRVDHQR